MGLLSKKSSKTKTKSMTKKENEFLKLVHAGGVVELHMNPMLASEVMKRNPRHYVTRHDFFKFPSIVVSPESILTPGNVFLIVPCRTVRHLSKSTNINANNINQSFSSLHPDYRPYKDSQISNSNKIRCFPKQPSISISKSFVKSGESRKHVKVSNMSQSQSFRKKPVFFSSGYSSRDSAKVNSRTRNGRLTHSEQIPKLKPCLKKDKNHSGSSRRNLRVRFDLNDHGVNTTNFTTGIYSVY